MSLSKVIYEVDYSAYGGGLAGVRAAIPRRMAGNCLPVTEACAGGGGRGCASLTLGVRRVGGLPRRSMAEAGWQMVGRVRPVGHIRPSHLSHSSHPSHSTNHQLKKPLAFVTAIWDNTHSFHLNRVERRSLTSVGGTLRPPLG